MIKFGFIFTLLLIGQGQLWASSFENQINSLMLQKRQEFESFLTGRIASIVPDCQCIVDIEFVLDKNKIRSAEINPQSIESDMVPGVGSISQIEQRIATGKELVIADGINYIKRINVLIYSNQVVSDSSKKFIGEYVNSRLGVFGVRDIDIKFNSIMAKVALDKLSEDLKVKKEATAVEAMLVSAKKWIMDNLLPTILLVIAFIFSAIFMDRIIKAVNQGARLLAGSLEGGRQDQETGTRHQEQAITAPAVRDLESTQSTQLEYKTYIHDHAEKEFYLNFFLKQKKYHLVIALMDFAQPLELENFIQRLSSEENHELKENWKVFYNKDNFQGYHGQSIAEIYQTLRMGALDRKMIYQFQVTQFLDQASYADLKSFIFKMEPEEFKSLAFEIPPLKLAYLISSDREVLDLMRIIKKMDPETAPLLVDYSHLVMLIPNHIQAIESKDKPENAYQSYLPLELENEFSGKSASDQFNEPMIEMTKKFLVSLNATDAADFLALFPTDVSSRLVNVFPEIKASRLLRKKKTISENSLVIKKRWVDAINA